MPPLTEEEISGLYRAFRDRIFRYLLSLGRDEEVANDLLQEVFLRVHESRNLYRGDSEHFLSWAFVIARNVYFNYNRKEKRISHNDSSIIEDIPDEKSEGTESRIEKKIIRKEIRDAILCLPDPEKSVILLREIQGKTLEETARILGFSVRTLSRKMIKALGLLKAELEKRGIEP